MKTLFQNRLILLVAALTTWTMQMFAQSTRTVMQPQFGKQVITVASDETITFYDPWGENGIFEYGRHNTHSLAVFTPADANKAVVISFEYIDMHSLLTKDDEDGSVDIYEGEMNVYDGDADATNSWVWATAISDVHNGKSLPTEGLLAHHDGTYSNVSYSSTAADGALSIGCFWRTAKNSRGWKATVKCVERKEMTTIAAGANYDNVASEPQRRKAVALGSFFITTDGVLNPDHLHSVSFKFTRNDGVFNPSALRVYRGTGTYFDGEEPIETYYNVVDDTYTLNLDETLTTGKNIFTIAGDVLVTAPFGGKATLSITKVTTEKKPSSVRPFDKGTPKTITIPPVVLMETGSRAVTVGDTQLDFYDDGGSSGDVTPGFEGTITFIPETTGKKIRVDFKQVSLSMGSIYHQQINVYNGRTKSADNLLASLKYSEKGVFNSTADDGCLTIEFLSGGTSQTSSGFHAVVSQEIPNAMELNKIEVMAGSEDWVNAGDENQPIMKFNLQTINTLPALEVTGFAFTTGNTYPIITKATIFYLGKSKDFNTAVKVGETEIVNDNLAITATSPIVLTEGNNYFALAYDISDEAVKDQTIDANFVSLSFYGKTINVENGSSKGNRTVENIILSHRGQGTVTTTIASEFDFMSKDEFSNQHSYEAGSDNRINIFVPKHSNAICQIDFTEFLIQYVEGYEGAHKSKFEIYSGQGANSNNLLWKLSSVADRDKGPGKILRSTSEDGALTVVFNPNDELGNYVAPGFKAIVNEYTPSIMSLKEVVVTQASTDVINNGASDEPLLSMNVKTQGNLSTISMKELAINTKQSASYIKSVKVYYAGDKNISGQKGVIVGEGQPSSNSQLTITLTNALNLTEGDNYFNILVDVKDDAPTGAIIDAAITAIKLNDNQTTIENGDPTGERIVKNITPKDMQLNSLLTTAMANGNVRKGETDVVMLRVDIDVEGENKLLTLEGLNVEATGSGIEKIRAYQTGLSDTFSPANMIGESTEQPFYINSRYLLQKEGTHYIWIVCDVKNDAKVGEKISISLKNITLSGKVVTPSNNQTVTMTIVSGKHGEITVGAEGDYSTIQAAVDAISDGIDGAVTISILPGIYNERVRVPNIPGTSENNTITIKGITGNPRDVHIYHNTWEELPYTDDRMEREFGLFTFDGANYVTLRGVEITTTALNYPSLVHLKNAARHITIDSCYLHTESTINNLEGVNLIYGYSKNVANQNNDYLKVTNNLLEGGYIGINMGGTSYVNLPKELGGLIEGNILREQGFKAIYVMDELGAVIKNNTISNTSSLKGNYSAIDTQIRDDYSKPMIIEGNKINLNCPATAYGMYLRELKGTQDCPVTIINNEIVFQNNQDDAYPIFMTRTSKNVHIAHNTLNVSGFGGPVIRISQTMDENVNIQNNIMQTTSGAQVINLGRSGNAGKINFSNNIYFTNGASFGGAAANDIEYETFDDWTEATGDKDSFNKMVTFLSEELLASENTLEGDLLKAKQLDFVKTDICGTTRSLTPSIGAYEYDESDEAPKMLDGYPFVGNITDNSATITISPDCNATAFVIIRLEEENAPSTAEILNSQNRALVRKNEVIDVDAESLSKGETFIGYIVLKSLRNRESQVYVTEPFTAEGYKLVEIPTPELSTQGDLTISEGTEALLNATVQSGTAPFTITWRNGLHNIIKEETIEAGETSTLNYQPAECDDYFVSVIDKNGKMDADTFRIIVTGSAVTATFENLYVDEIGYYNGRDLRGSFVSGSYLFESNNMPQYSYWYGFAYANSTSTIFENLYPDQFNNAVGGGNGGSANYVVAYPENCRIRVLNKPSDTINGFFLANSAYTMDAIKNGDGITDGAFGKGDYLILTITGYHPDGTTESKDVYLADYTSNNSADHYTLNGWHWIELSSLGDVESISFKMSSSRNNEYGMTTPAYFCIDDFGGNNNLGIHDNNGTNYGNQLSSEPVAIFSIDGKQLRHLGKGVNIVKMSDGSTRKVVVKN